MRSVTGEKYDRITGYGLDPVPDYTPEPGMYEEAGGGAEAGAGNEVEEEPEYANVYDEEPPF